MPLAYRSRVIGHYQIEYSLNEMYYLYGFLKRINELRRLSWEFHGKKKKERKSSPHQPHNRCNLLAKEAASNADTMLCCRLFDKMYQDHSATHCDGVEASKVYNNVSTRFSLITCVYLLFHASTINTVTFDAVQEPFNMNSHHPLARIIVVWGVYQKINKMSVQEKKV